LRGGRVLQNDPNYVSHQQQTHTDNTQTTETQQTHTVKAGETLFSISRQYNTTVEQIRQWNPQLGEVLRIDEVLTINNQSVSAPTTTNQAQQTHTVKTGETLFSISQRYNTTVGQLRRWNPQLGEILRVGEVLIVRR
jgi:LysM repeat protein